MKKNSIILASLIGLAIGVTGTLAAYSPFKDMPADHWAIDAVNWGKINKLVEGYADGTFQGDKNVSRYEIIQVFKKYNDMKAVEIGYLQKQIDDLKRQLNVANQNDGIITPEDKLTEAEIDLNGDGIKDKIVANFEKNKSYPDLNIFSSFTLTINGKKIEKTTGYLQGYFRIVDIDKNDKFKEIVIGDIGPSNDYTSFFYTFDNNEIKTMGETEGVYRYDYSNQKMMDFPGNGTFTTVTRGEVLQTWYYEDQYGLNTDHTLKHLPKDLYAMGTEVTMLKDLPLQTSRTDSKVITTLKTGDKATLVSSDNKQWVLAEDKNGVEGWFELGGDFNLNIKALNLPATDVFEGLVMVD